MTGGRPQSNDAYVRATPAQIAAATPPAASTTPPATTTTTSSSTSQTAEGVIQNILTTFGLGSAMASDGTPLASWAWNQVIGQGIDPTTADPTALTDDVITQIQGTDAFKERFPGIIQQMANSQNPTTPADYINYEDTARGLATQYGVDYNTIFTPDVIAAGIVGGQSPSELQSRFGTYVDAYESAPTQVQQAYDQFYGTNGLTAFVATIANPTMTDDQLKTQMEAAQIQGAGSSVGLDVGQQRAEQLAKMGVSYSTALNDLRTVTAEGGLYVPTVGEAASSTGPAATPAVTADDQGIGAATGLDPQAEQQVQQLKEERENSFKGGGGAEISETAGGGAYGAGAAASS